MARLPIPGADDGKWGEILNEYLSQAHNSDGTLRQDLITKSSIGLGQVDNTSDISKPISQATQAAIDTKLSMTQDQNDNISYVDRRIGFRDRSDGSAKGSVLSVEHYGNGTNGAAYNGQTFGVDIHNWPGSKQGLVLHQYSNAGPAMQIDNTDTNIGLLIKNAINTTNNPSSPGGGTGNYIEARTTDNATRFSVRNQGSVVLNIKSDADYPSLWITNPSPQKAIRIQQQAAQVAVSIEAESGASGYYPLDVTGQNYGPRFSTSSDGQKTLTLQKNGTGSGDALHIVNRGIGASLLINDGTSNNWLIDKQGVVNWQAASLSASSASAGSANSLPATPAGYINAKVNGTAVKIPYYNV